jgi:Bacterial sugar transferase
VLRGEMGLVGPRPLLLEYLPHYSPAQARRHDVRPGITSWANVQGRNALSWERRLALDVWYVDHWSLALDLKILLMTVIKVLRREGISPEGQPTMPRFDEYLGRPRRQPAPSCGMPCAAPGSPPTDHPMRCAGRRRGRAT